MPLRVVRRTDTGTLWIVGTVRAADQKRGVRIRKRAASDDRRIAEEEARTLELSIIRDRHLGERPRSRTFAEAVASYLDHKERSAATNAFLTKLLQHFGPAMTLDKIGQEAADKARAAVLRPGALPGTVKRNLITPLRAVMRHAERRGWCRTPLFDLPEEPKGRTAFLVPAQASALIRHAGQLRPLIVFLICTGCRAGEALALEWRDVDLIGARVLLHEGETKGGGRRYVSLPPAALAALDALPHRDGAVFLSRHRAPYTAAGSLRRLWRAAARAAGLPPEITPHVLRHTWASWHYALHRDLLRLARDGGWATTAQVERYTHLMPEGLQGAIRAVWGMRADRSGKTGA